jgi:hypothetical protein
VVLQTKKTGPKSYGGYAWAEESLLPGDTSPLIISNDDDDLVFCELFTRADPDPTQRSNRHPRGGCLQAADLGGRTPGGAPKRV